MPFKKSIFFVYDPLYPDIVYLKLNFITLSFTHFVLQMNQFSTEHVKYYCISVVELSMNRLKKKKLVKLKFVLELINYNMAFWYLFILVHNVYILPTLNYREVQNVAFFYFFN